MLEINKSCSCCSAYPSWATEDAHITLLPSSAAYKWPSHFLRLVHSQVALTIAEYTDTNTTNFNPELYTAHSFGCDWYVSRSQGFPGDSRSSPTRYDLIEFHYLYRTSKPWL